MKFPRSVESPPLILTKYDWPTESELYVKLTEPAKPTLQPSPKELAQFVPWYKAMFGVFNPVTVKVAAEDVAVKLYHVSAAGADMSFPKTP